MDIFILGGQSNMAGWGGIRPNYTWDGVVPPECTPPPGTSILRLSAGLEWETAREPLHADIDVERPCGVGPGLVFAAQSAAPGATIGLVPCAIGGTSMAEWHSSLGLYTNMIQRARSAISQGGPESRIRALLWYQGASDTTNPRNASQFFVRLKELISNVRRDLLAPNLPIIQVGIITSPRHPFPHLLDQVRKAQRAIDIPGVYYVDAKGLPLQQDNVHLTTEAQVMLGLKLAAVYKEKIASGTGKVSETLEKRIRRNFAKLCGNPSSVDAT